MSNLVVFDFDGIHTADDVLNKLRSLQKEYLIDLEDACVVEREKGGKVHIKQAVNLTKVGATAGGTRGMLLGGLVGLIFMNPLLGVAIGGITGAGFGALSGSLADFGIRDDFVRQVGETIPEGSSALFVRGIIRALRAVPKHNGRQGSGRNSAIQASDPEDVAL
jgi:uncharacterized membrane protein